ncbi:MAG: hypothetical protein ABIS35_05255 [Terracoccus sp.]
MGENTGLFVIGGIIIIVLIGAFFMWPRGRDKEVEPQSPHHADEIQLEEVGHGEHLVGSPPIDVVSPEGFGTAVPGAGALPDEAEESDASDDTRGRGGPLS